MNNTLKTISPIFTLFILVSCIIAGFHEKMALLNISAKVVFVSNGILFFMSIVSIILHYNAQKSNNPNAVIRSVMLATLLKFIIVGISIFSYMKVTGAGRNKYGVFCAMVLYLIYTFFETIIALRLNKTNGSK